MTFLFGKIGVGLSRTKPQRGQGGARGDYFFVKKIVQIGALRVPF